MNIQEIIKQVAGKTKLPSFGDDSMCTYWKAWYEGKTKWHSYNVYNGKKWVKQERMTLGMAKRVCEDWANLIINEKTDIVLDKDEAKKQLYEILEDCDFWSKANKGVEKSFALGMGAFVVTVENLAVDEEGVITNTEKGKVNVKFVNRTNIVPITIVDDKVVECAFISKDTEHTYITLHLLKEGKYVIYNIIAEGKGTSLNYDVQNKEQYYEFNTQSDIPWFAIVHPNICNNVDIDSPFGISIYANSLDVLKGVDLVYDSFSNEFILGKKRIFISAKNQTLDVDGNLKPVFDSNDVAFYTLPEADDGKPIIANDTQTLRVADHVAGIQQQLNLLSYNCGFGTNHYKFDGGGVATATQIISENSDMFRNLKRHEIIVEEVLISLTKAIIYASNTFTGTSIIADEDKIEIMFDDSIIEDKQVQKQEDRLDVQIGAMSLVEYRMKWYAEDEETAQEAVAEMSKYSIVDYTPTEEDLKDEGKNKDEGNE